MICGYLWVTQYIRQTHIYRCASFYIQIQRKIQKPTPLPGQNPRYCISKESILHSNLLHSIGHNFFDIQQAPGQGVGVDWAPASHGIPNRLKEERNYSFCSVGIIQCMRYIVQALYIVGFLQLHHYDYQNVHKTQQIWNKNIHKTYFLRCSYTWPYFCC